MINLLEAIQNIVRSTISDLVSQYKGKNRINGVGDVLEVFIKDAFASTINTGGESERIVKYSEVFSYAGNQNNPPDLMIKSGGAVEVTVVPLCKEQRERSYRRLSQVFSNLLIVVMNKVPNGFNVIV